MLMLSDINQPNNPLGGKSFVVGILIVPYVLNAYPPNPNPNPPNMLSCHHENYINTAATKSS